MMLFLSFLTEGFLSLNVSLDVLLKMVLLSGICGKYTHGSKYKSSTRLLPPNMPGFPLLNVPPENFVKIINKVFLFLAILLD